MNKNQNINEFKRFCENNRLLENTESVSFFCEYYRKKETISNSKQITQLYKYVENNKSWTN